VTQSEIEVALKQYGFGFKKGFRNFEKDLLGGNPETILLSNSHFARIVFDFVTGGFFGKGGYPIQYGTDNYFETWHETGIEAGQYYKAWYLMLKYYSVFEPFFIEKQTKKKTELSAGSQQSSFDVILNDIRNSENKFCK